MADTFTVAELQHPSYRERVRDWKLWRDTYEGGRNFINFYLEKFSTREDASDYERRKKVTYNPAFAQEAVDEIKNSIFSRLVDISRRGGSDSYNKSIQGMTGGIDLLGSSMNSFIGRKVLPELLTMAKVGIFVDMPPVSPVTLADAKGARPYVYIYRVEDIRSWCYDEGENSNEFSNLLLRDYYNTTDPVTGLPNGIGTRYRRMWIENGIVHVQFYDESGVETDVSGNKNPDSFFTLGISKIPFVVAELSDSLLVNVAQYQVALLNLGSSDIAYALNSNYPFYTEQFDPRAMSEFVRQPGPVEGGQAADAGTSQTQQVRTGNTKGRRYPQGMDRPDFIHPSPEPLRASMDKQEQMKAELRQLVNLAVTNLSPKMASAESKGMDRQGLESGLSYIGLELETVERKIAEYWAMYEKTPTATINYPTNYSVKTEAERQAEAEKLRELLPVISSRTYQKEICKRIAELTISRQVSAETLDKILTEIDKSEALTSDPDVIFNSVINGILDLETASQILGYPKDTVEKAAKDHTERLKRIAETQAPNNAMVNGAARGVPDLAGDKTGGQQEKAASKDTTTDPVIKDKTRGEGK